MKYLIDINKLFNNEQDLNHQHDMNRLILQLNKSTSPKDLYELLREVSDNIINSNENKTINKMKEKTYGYGKDVVFENVGEGNLDLVIVTKFTHDTATGNTAVITEAQMHAEAVGSTLGSGTYKECYDLCVAKKLELEPKVYNWENCFSKQGWWICAEGNIHECYIDSDVYHWHKTIYPNREDAESALAYCQLLHVVNAINKDYPIGDYTEKYKLYCENDEFKLSYISGNLNWGGWVLSEKGAKILIRDNEELLKTYFKIK